MHPSASVPNPRCEASPARGCSWRARRRLRRVTHTRVHPPAVVRDPRARTPSGVRHRSVLQPAASALDARLHHTSLVRSEDLQPQSRSRGIATMSGEPGQVHPYNRCSAWCRRGTCGLKQLPRSHGLYRSRREHRCLARVNSRVGAWRDLAPGRRDHCYVGDELSRCLRNHSSASMLSGTTASPLGTVFARTSVKMTRWSSRVVDPQPIRPGPYTISGDSNGSPRAFAASRP